MYGKSIDWLGQKFLEIGNFVLEIVEIEKYIRIGPVSLSLQNQLLQYPFA